MFNYVLNVLKLSFLATTSTVLFEKGLDFERVTPTVEHACLEAKETGELSFLSSNRNIPWS